MYLPCFLLILPLKIKALHVFSMAAPIDPTNEPKTYTMVGLGEGLRYIYIEI